MRTHRRAYVAQGGWIRGVGLAAFYGRMPLRLIKDLYFEVQNHRLSATASSSPMAS
jgi:hypothetical protein